MTNVLVVGYGTIGQRLADGVSLQDDMNLVGVVDAAMSLGIRALKEKGMPYDCLLYTSWGFTALTKKPAWDSSRATGS